MATSKRKNPHAGGTMKAPTKLAHGSKTERAPALPRIKGPSRSAGGGLKKK